MAFALFDPVILTVDLIKEGLKSGTRGTIVEIFDVPVLGYAVEFFDNEGNTIDWFVLCDEQLRLDTDRLRARPKKAVDRPRGL